MTDTLWRFMPFAFLTEIEQRTSFSRLVKINEKCGDSISKKRRFNNYIFPKTLSLMATMVSQNIVEADLMGKADFKSKRK